MKIGISTIIDNTNYGNRLQNYASKKVLLNMELNPETLNPIFEDKYKFYSKHLIKRIIVNLANILNFKNEEIIQRLRVIRFESFTNKFVPNKKFFINDLNDLSNMVKDFDYFITGSDQVWNYNFRPNLDIDFLQFVEKDKRVAYAPSFGVSEIPNQYKEEYTKYLNEMSYLSVREHAGQKIIKDLTGRDSEVLIDPTMMLDKEEWLKVTSKPKCMPKKKYLLTYVLGNQTEEFKAFVSKLAKEKNLEILNLLDPLNKDIHCVDPGEFVYLINESDVVITDSFHGAVFSILMQTPFVIFERQDKEVSMNSRIDTLVSTFKMESRLSTHIKSIDDVYNIDFSHIDGILKHEREKAINYLKNAFSMN
ncbi:polysaccharide pyruvyl transferase family protein [Romboutsia ilealis]|uniref:polysaccharide pyruvyl transferase family protein n=1 Tax=Romboutsia ilealis TaxID=1115758 RepID=UPI002573DB42|nr:polysaccharide pyruvyl transferase family protein [Romboutsia ilealis]